ncbi:hypothetical protein TIFTF001_056486 [Ficus carica]|uniref:Uncharacterized protein n=1 Tax=Ficus carica TaxID=3494 RepID=A0AA88EIU7_FICCA|nr:hypothetical protein TIFTF001_056486 [Ficus carica]
MELDNLLKEEHGYACSEKHRSTFGANFGVFSQLDELTVFDYIVFGP